MKFYTSPFKQSEIRDIAYYGANKPSTEGTVKQAVFSLNGQEFMCIDSNAGRGFTFTPAISLFLKCGGRKKLMSILKNYRKVEKFSCYWLHILSVKNLDGLKASLACRGN